MTSPIEALSNARAAVASLGVGLVLLSCSQEPPPAEHTVAEYRANAGLRREEFARCANDPGALGNAPDCVNAREAARLEDIGSVRSVPPIELPRPKR